MPETLYFQGRTLPPGIGVTSLTVTGPPLEARTAQLIGRTGLLFLGGQRGSREVRAECVIAADTAETRARRFSALTLWAASEKEAPLRLPGLHDLYLNAVCTQLPQWKAGRASSECTLVFTCFDPRFYSVREKSAAEDITVGGTCPAPVRLEYSIDAVLTDPVWQLDDHCIAFDGTIGPGEIVIDTRLAMAELDGEDITDLVTLDSDIDLALSPGSHTLIAPDGAEGRAYWRDCRL